MLRRNVAAIVSASALYLSACQSYQPIEWSYDSMHKDWRSESAVLVESGAMLSGHQVLELALLLNPGLRLARAEAGVATATREYAGLLDDPALSTEVRHALKDTPEPWVLGAGLSFSIPLTNELSKQTDAATAAERAAFLRVAAREWEVQLELALLLKSYQSLSKSLVYLEENTGLLRQLNRKAEALVRNDQMSRASGRAISLELLDRESQRLELEAEIHDARLRILETIGLVPDADVNIETKEILQFPASGSDISSNLDLQILRAEFDAADHAYHMEVLRQYPRLSLGPLFERDGDQDSAGVGIEVPIPLFNRNRLAIAQAQAQRKLALTKARVRQQALVFETKRLAAQISNVEAQLEFLRRGVTKEIQEQLTEVMKLADLGQLDVFVMLDTLNRAWLVQERERELVLQMEELRGALAKAYGPGRATGMPLEGEVK